MRGADIFLGLSVADVLTTEMVQSMNEKPIVFALANPNPEISYDKAMASRKDLITFSEELSMFALPPLTKR